MIVALDIDGTIDESVELFHILSTVLRSGGHRLIILTYRDPARVSQTQEQLRDWGISYDEIVFAESLDDKGRICRDWRLLSKSAVLGPAADRARHI